MILNFFKKSKMIRIVYKNLLLKSSSSYVYLYQTVSNIYRSLFLKFFLYLNYQNFIEAIIIFFFFLGETII